MSAAATKTPTLDVDEVYDDETFSADAYINRPVPKMDGRRATNLDLRFSGSGTLNRTSDDDLALLEAARLGCEIRLIVIGEVSGKGFRLNRKADDEEELSYTCTVKVLSVEAGEIA